MNLDFIFFLLRTRKVTQKVLRKMFDYFLIKDKLLRGKLFKSHWFLLPNLYGLEYYFFVSSIFGDLKINWHLSVKGWAGGKVSYLQGGS